MSAWVPATVTILRLSEETVHVRTVRGNDAEISMKFVHPDADWIALVPWGDRATFLVNYAEAERLGLLP